jgi:ferredoxin-NADP reductase
MPEMTDEARVKLEVLERRELTAEVVQLRFGSIDQSELPAWEPGAHIDLHLPSGVTRQYSLCGSSDDHGSWTVAVMRDQASRGGSQSVWDDLVVGTRLEVGRPRNDFPLVEAARYIFVAGGIGITPLKPMVHRVAAAGANWRLVYGGRRRDSMAFASELHEQFGERVELVPEDEHGLIDLAAVLGAPDPDAVVYVCGPEPLISAVERSTVSWHPKALHFERFVARAVAEAGGDDRAFVVALRGGRKIPVPPGVSALAALRAEGFELASSCEAGTCGTCEVRVLAGVPEHRDDVLEEDEKEANDAMMICVSRALTPVLELDL